MEETVKEMEFIYSLSDFDVIKEYINRKDERLFKDYCLGLTQKFEDYAMELEEAKKKVCYRFMFNNSHIEEKDIDNLIRKHIYVEVEQDVLMFEGGGNTSGN